MRVRPVLAVLGLSVGVWVSCKFAIDPQKGQFSCDRNDDCGSGYECTPRADGGRGVCFPMGLCASLDFTNDNQHCGDCATACVTGTRCVASVCRESNCSDGIDNDNNGLTDCQDPFCAGLSCSITDPSVNCGALLADGGMIRGSDGGRSDAGVGDAGTADAGASDAGGSLIRACVPRERICDDGIDNDGDGATDCADDDCDGQQCAPGRICRDGGCQ